MTPEPRAAHRALVTGGAGFVALHAIPALLAAGTEVIAVDDLSGSSRWRLEEHPRLEQVELDLLETEALTALVARASPDLVVHLAARHVIPYCDAHPDDTRQVNVAGTASLTNALTQLSAVRVVHASTAAVYAPSNDPVDEGARLAPTDVYGSTKLAAEGLMREFAVDGRREVDLRVLRLFNVYGRGDTNPHLLPEIVEQLRASDAITLGNLESRRDYVHVRDVAGLIRLLALGFTTDETVNVGTGEASSAREVVAELASVTGRALSVVSTASRQRSSDRPVLVADPARWLRLLGGRRPVPLRDGLADLAVHEGLGRSHARLELAEAE